MEITLKTILLKICANIQKDIGVGEILLQAVDRDGTF